MQQKITSDTTKTVRMDPLFLIGYSRSGTTMLRLILNEHPSIAMASEGEYFQRLPMRYRNKKYTQEDIENIIETVDSMKNGFLHRKVERESFRKLLRQNLPATLPQLLACIYTQWAAQAKKPEARWADKKPQHWKYVYKLKEWYPQSQFIYIVRDPRDVVASMKEYFPEKIKMKWFFPLHLVFAWHYRIAFESMSKEAHTLSSERCFKTRYESLVENPQKTLTEICQFLQVEFTAKMLNFYERAQDAKVLPERQTLNKVFAETTKPLHKGRIGRYQETMSEKEISEVEFICQELMKKHHYESSAPVLSKWNQLKIQLKLPLLTMFWKLLIAARRLRGSL